MWYWRSIKLSSKEYNYNIFKQYMCDKYGYDLDMWNFDFEKFYKRLRYHEKYMQPKEVQKLLIKYPGMRQILNANNRTGMKTNDVLEIFSYALKKVFGDSVEILGEFTYDDYLQSHEWQELKKHTLRRYGNRCATCNKKSGKYGVELHVHHRTYENLGFEEHDDLIVLCKNCHAKIHDK